jgi:putative peptidoglycan lipid II flippase
MSWWQRLRDRPIVRGTAILGVTQLLASIAGLIRDRTLTNTFPGLDVVDVYLAAFRPSDLLFQAAIMSALGTVLVPVLARYHARGDRDELHRVLSSTMCLAGMSFGILSLVFAGLLPWLQPWLAGGFTGPSAELYIHFGRLALCTNFLFVFGTALGQYLLTEERYLAYGITPVLYTLGTIGGTIVLTPWLGAYGPMVGTLLGAIAYVAVRLSAALRAGARLQVRWWHPELHEMGRLMLPRVLSLSAFQGQLLVLDALATFLPAGSVTISNYARNFQSVLVGVVGIAVAQTIYAPLSKSVAAGAHDAFARSYRLGWWTILALTVPGAIALWLCAPLAAWLVHLSSQLTLFSLVLGIFAISVPLESLNHLQLRAFYAHRNTLLPSLAGIAGGMVTVGLAWGTIDSFGLPALALGYAAGELTKVVLLAVLLPRITSHWQHEY